MMAEDETTTTTRRSRDDDEDRIIETVFYELDNSMFAVALIAGVAIGAILIYLWVKKPTSINDLIPTKVTETVTAPTTPPATTDIPTEGIEYIDDMQKEDEREYAEQAQEPSFTFSFPSTFSGNSQQ